jgi:hypothetical protein
MKTNEIKKKAGVVSRFMNLLNSVTKSKTQNKIIENRSSLMSMLSRSFPSLKKFQTKKLNKPKSGEMILKQYVNIAHSKMNVLISYKDLKDIFKQLYPYLVRTLVIGNTIGSTAVITSAAGMFIVPIAAICAIAVMTNASTHGISTNQATANFKRSFKEFMTRNNFTKKEKSFAFFPIIIVSMCAWLIKYCGTNKIGDILQDMAKITTIKGEFANTFGKTATDVAADKLKGVTLKKVFIVFSIALIIYLFLSVIDQMILRKGESPTHEV